MCGPPAHAYVYRVYGLHTCLNVVGAADGGVGAVLVRAVAPLEGIVALAVRRTPPARTAPPRARLAAGPGSAGAGVGDRPAPRASRPLSGERRGGPQVPGAEAIPGGPRAAGGEHELRAQPPACRCAEPEP